MTEFEYNRDEVPQEVLLELVLDFNRNFAGYVKEVDADLFERAKFKDQIGKQADSEMSSSVCLIEIRNL
jgi:hypothetical protein